MRMVDELWGGARATPRRRVTGEAVATFALGLALIAIGVTGTFGPRSPELPSRWFFVLPLAAICLLLLAKRRYPGLAGTAGTVVVIGDQAMGGSIGVVVGYFDLLYCIALWGRPQVLHRAQVLVTIAVVAAAVAPFVLTGDLRAAVLLSIVVFTLLATPLWWGRSVRSQAELAEVAAARTEDLRRLAELREVEVLQAERSRMAHELHDALAGNLAAIGIHAEAALSRPATPAASAEDHASLVAMREASVAAADELRAMVHILRSGEDERTAPARLAEVDGVLEQARRRGLHIDDRLRDPAPALPAAIDHAAYRIVQESLTNAAKHAPGSRVDLSLGAADDHLEIRVDNTLTVPGPTAARTVGGGVGLASMRERTSTLGGTFTAGRQDGTWRVRARLPLTMGDGERTDEGGALRCDEGASKESAT